MEESNLKKQLRITRDRVLWEKWFLNRGKAIMSDFIELLTFTTIAGLFTKIINDSFGTNYPVGFVLKIAPFIYFGYWVLGRVDFYKIHLIQKENEIAMISNPALYKKVCEMYEEIKKIKEKIC